MWAALITLNHLAVSQMYPVPGIGLGGIDPVVRWFLIYPLTLAAPVMLWSAVRTFTRWLWHGKSSRIERGAAILETARLRGLTPVLDPEQTVHYRDGDVLCGAEVRSDAEASKIWTDAGTTYRMCLRCEEAR
jgi:hypothetical protein